MNKVISIMLAMMLLGCSASKILNVKPFKAAPKWDDTGIYESDYKLSGRIATVNIGDTLDVTGRTWMFFQVKYADTVGFVKKDEVLPVGKDRLFREKQNYLLAVDSQSTKFKIPKDSLNIAWARAESFISKYSRLNIDHVSDYSIQTIQPGDGSIHIGYKVTKTPKGKFAGIDVTAIYGTHWNREDAVNNAKILAYYIKTGKLKPENIKN